MKRPSQIFAVPPVTWLVLLAAGCEARPPQPPVAAAPATAAVTVGSLMMAKANGEGQARLAAAAVRDRRVSPADAAVGRQLYTDMQAALNDLAAEIARMVADPTAADRPRQVEDKLALGLARWEAFMAWNERAGVQRYIDSNPLADVRAGLPALFEDIRRGDPEVQTQIVRTLDGARFADWEAIAAAP